MNPPSGPRLCPFIVEGADGGEVFDRGLATAAFRRLSTNVFPLKG
jgi:hypothetical protein